MDTHTLLHLIQSSESISSNQLEMLKEEARQYPYFQALHLLVAKAEGKSEDIKRAAAYSADRGVLMRIIKSQFNPDVNLPNIDHLEIQKEDLNAFERLDRTDEAEELPLENVEKDEDFRSQLEALAEGQESEEDFKLEKDSDFDEQFEQVDIEEPSENEQDNEQEEEEKAYKPDPIDEAPELPSEEPEKQEQEEEEQSIDAELLASIEAARRSRERYMNEDFASRSKKEEEAEKNEVEDDKAEKKETTEEEPQEPPKEQMAKPKEQQDTPEKPGQEPYASTSPHIKDEESEEVSDPDLMASLYALRKSKEEAMRNREEAEARIEEMNKEVEERIEQVKKQEAKTEAPKSQKPKKEEAEEKKEDFPIPETEYPHPEYDDPFSDSISELEEKKGDADDSDSASEEDLFGVDTSLFELDNWLEDESKGKPKGHSKKEIEEAQARISEIEESDEMTLEEKIKAQNSIISQFIEKSPKIAPNKDQLDSSSQSEDLAKKSVEDAPTFVSENLASIMVRQGKYGQAIKIYQQLMLKYPDKKAYFADLIEHLENKQK